MTHDYQDVEAGVERAICDCSATASPLHALLRRLFSSLGAKLRALGDVAVLLDGNVTALSATAEPEEILKCAGKDPSKYCVFRMDPCGGAPTPLCAGEQLRDCDRLVITLCTPPPDGLGRSEALEADLRRLSAVARNARVTALMGGQEALLADFRLETGETLSCGVLLNPSYPAVGPDWFLIDERFDLVGFGGQKRGPHQHADLRLSEYSIHPPKNEPAPTAAEHVISVVTRRLGNLRRKAA